MRLITPLVTLILLHSSLTPPGPLRAPVVLVGADGTGEGAVTDPFAAASAGQAGARLGLAGPAAPTAGGFLQPPGLGIATFLTVGDLARPTDRGAAAVSGGEWAWPIEGAVIHPFAPGDKPWLPGHRGVDLAGEEGQLVHAAGDGVVHFAGWVVSRPVVSILHRNGLLTTYEPVNPLVHTGDVVAAGEVIGSLAAGHAGCIAACLHWGLRQGDNYLDPLLLLGFGRVRLLPLDARHADASSWGRPAARRETSSIVL